MTEKRPRKSGPLFFGETNYSFRVTLHKNMGILSMKVMGHGMIVGNGAGRASPTELLQFNLSQPVASVVTWLRANGASGRERAGGAQLYANQ